MTEFDKTYMGMAQLMANHSKAKRKQVGAVLVTPIGTVIPGYNGTPAGWDNSCEEDVNGSQVTKKEVIHAELNVILRAAKQGVSVLGGTIYVTLAPCVSCASMIAQAGIVRVVYGEAYRDMSGVDMLRDRLSICHQEVK